MKNDIGLHDSWLKTHTYYNKHYDQIKYLHLIKLGAIKGMMVNFLEAISVQHPKATDEVCHFRLNKIMY